jgi:hypothetical protein
VSSHRGPRVAGAIRLSEVRIVSIVRLLYPINIVKVIKSRIKLWLAKHKEERKLVTATRREKGRIWRWIWARESPRVWSGFIWLGIWCTGGRTRVINIQAKRTQISWLPESLSAFEKVSAPWRYFIRNEYQSYMKQYLRILCYKKRTLWFIKLSF